MSQENSPWLASKSSFLLEISTVNFGNCGLPQAPFDHCLFIGEKVIAICYVDDISFLARKENDIVKLSVQLHIEEVDLEQEVDAAGFL